MNLINFLLSKGILHKGNIPSIRNENLKSTKKDEIFTIL